MPSICPKTTSGSLSLSRYSYPKLNTIELPNTATIELKFPSFELAP